ncbi:Glucose/arabinose dehydrogenase, beta-propeller fold [Cnuella takakiae]|uniref:Glucose/arabinose dehydrogenase, beta-propeller fold n=1 Tax=Cnuella takakiae TaxID=1302690 RepID=A0A1M4YAP3_9BACT|nr:PQQ-dependent sugar dehydrogenase [Cnuella takakiae]OLY94873.1 sorbosone dehydrogenase [Cnuella takakiae]SHF02887.1 Glucose/arabinose dehydrogenase, beta-propeller fold [Cnuella takakiae]
MKLRSFAGVLAAVIASATAFANDTTRMVNKAAAISLPQGFTATVVAENLGQARHIAVNSNGDIYVKLGKLKEGKGIVGLRDLNSDGKADKITSFAEYPGTGMVIKNGYLYASSNSEIFRYKLNERNEINDIDKPELIVTGLWDKRTHNSKSLTLDNAGNIYVNIGAPSNACQVKDRTKGSPGQDPCPILDSAGGIWQFKADKPNQTYADGVRYATGVRNVVGLDWNTATNSLFVMQHGRDQLSNLFPELYDSAKSAEVPAEEMFEVKQAGANFGWPYCYYDPLQNKKMLAPEYGGDGKKQDRCAGVEQPVIAFPGHMAPNGLLFYTGTLFPERFRNGAFIAFHGSWNRAPLPQKGYFVAFVPFKDGKPAGPWETFAEGFMGAAEIATPNQAQYRPCGLAQGPDGALYVTDDAKGTVWKISYKQ